jgi:DNA-directed RNA polymerase subunit alpha
LLNFVLPKVELQDSSLNYGSFAIGPLESGYGITLGNALRRTLLSSLAGAAVTSMRISDVSHEFSAIPHVREDTTWVVLNVKQLRFQVDQDVPEEVTVRIEVRGEGPISGGDIICPPGVEVANPELLLLTADSSGADLDIEMTVQRGRGYLSTEEREGARLALGEIPVDAIFSPIRRVRYNVERARIGHQGGYDKLLLQVWTDGTIAPEDALRQGARLLVQHLVLVSGVEAVLPEEEGLEEEGIASALYEQEIEALGLNVRVYNCLRRAGITTVGEVLDSLSKGDDELLQIRNLGHKSLEELKERLRALDLLPSEGEEAEAEVEDDLAPAADEEGPEEEPVEVATEPPVPPDESDDVISEPAQDEGPETVSEEEVATEEAAESADEAEEGVRLDDALAAALRKAMLRGGADG